MYDINSTHENLIAQVWKLLFFFFYLQNSLETKTLQNHNFSSDVG